MARPVIPAFMLVFKGWIRNVARVLTTILGLGASVVALSVSCPIGFALHCTGE